MESREKLKQMRAACKLKSLAGFRNIVNVDMPEIPTERTKFPNTDNDWWYKVEIPHLDATACIYELDANSSFPPHFHTISTEQIILLTKHARLEIVTNEREEIIQFPNSVFFYPKEPHVVRNLSNLPITFMVIWTPKMNGFEATFE